jgi:hypothetical protein
METDKNQNKPKKPVRISKNESKKPMPKSTRTDMLKKQMIDALEKSLGVVTIACRNVGIHRSTFYDWMNNDPEFKRMADDVSEITLDFAESELHKQIRDGSTAATIFYLKTKGKKRGYIERSEIDINNNKPDFSQLTTDQIIDLLNEPDPSDE